MKTRQFFALALALLLCFSDFSWIAPAAYLLGTDFGRQDVVSVWMKFSILSVTFLPALSWALFGSFSVRLLETQTAENVAYVSTAGVIALGAFDFGLMWGSRLVPRRRSPHVYFTKTTLQLAGAIGLFLLFMHSYWMGATVFAGAWNQGDRHIVFGTALQGAMFGLALWLVAFRENQKARRRLVLFLLFITVPAILLKGARLDFLQVLVLLAVLEERFGGFRLKFNFKVFVLIVGGYVFFMFLGVWRFSGGFGAFRNFAAISNTFHTAVEHGGSPIVNGTFGDLAADVFGIADLATHSLLEYDSGSFLLRFVGSSLPRFITGQSLPLYDYYLNDFFGYGAVAGGFHPIAQGILAGGWLGVGVLYFLIGGILQLGAGTRLAFNRGVIPIFSLIFIIALSSIVRGSMYGLFSWYKGSLTALLLLVTLMVVSALQRKRM